MKTNVYSAVKLDSDQKAKIEAQLKRLFGNSLSVDYAVKPEVIGGLIIEQGDTVIDLGVQAKLQEMKKHLQK